MRVQVRFAITAKEWREARYLYRTRGERSSGDSWALLLIMVPLVGSIGDIAHMLSVSGFSPRGSVLPILLLLASASAAALLWRSRTRDRRAGEASGLTVGEWTVNIAETGFERFRQADGGASRMARSWEEFRSVRVGRHVIVLELGTDRGFEVLPLSALNAEEQAWLRRMTGRKIKPSRTPEEARTGIPQSR